MRAKSLQIYEKKKKISLTVNQPMFLRAKSRRRLHAAFPGNVDKCEILVHTLVLPDRRGQRQRTMLTKCTKGDRQCPCNGLLARGRREAVGYSDSIESVPENKVQDRALSRVNG